MMTYSLRRGVNQIASATRLLPAGILALAMGFPFVSIAAPAQTPTAPSVNQVVMPKGGPAPVAVTNYVCHILPVMSAAGQPLANISRPDCDNRGTGLATQRQLI